MEPQPFGHGNMNFRRGLPITQSALQWSHSLSAMETVPFRVRCPRTRHLQWSHSLSAMETRGLPLVFRELVKPSMEPQPFGHGNQPLRKLGMDVGAPSMEPQPFGHGNLSIWPMVLL